MRFQNIEQSESYKVIGKVNKSKSYKYTEKTCILKLSKRIVWGPNKIYNAFQGNRKRYC